MSIYFIVSMEREKNTERKYCKY